MSSAWAIQYTLIALHVCYFLGYNLASAGPRNYII